MKKISDTEFDQTLTLGQAYRIMYRFIEQYHARGESSTVDLLTELNIVRPDGGSLDPAQLDDFIVVAKQILEPENQ